MVKSVLQTEIFAIQERHRIAHDIFEYAGGFSPTMGIIGTVMGLIHVLANISTPDKLGPAIALAFTATLYGVSAANVIYFPIGFRLKNITRKEINIRLLMMEGLLALQGRPQSDHHHGTADGLPESRAAGQTKSGAGRRHTG